LHGGKIKPVKPYSAIDMEQQKLTALLHQQNTEIVERTPFCPNDDEIAAYFDRKSSHPGGKLSEQHLVTCGYCMARVRVLAQVLQIDDNEAIPETLLTVAHQFGQRPRRRLIHASAWAAAAVVIVTLFAIAGRGPAVDPGPGGQPPPASPLGEDARQLRNIDRGNPAPTIQAPIKGAHVRPDDLTIRWTPVPGSLYYDIRLVNAKGFLIWQERIEDNQSNLPDHLKLVSGDQYYVRVDAYLAEAKSISSQHVPFTIKGNN
jgi:hypothetical protein